MRRISLLALSLTSVLCAPAKAQTITYTFTGTIGSNFPGNPGMSVWDNVQPGDPFTMVCSVDGTTPGVPSPPGGTNYDNSWTAISIDVNGIQATPAINVSNVFLRNDFMAVTNCNDSSEFFAGVAGGDVFNFFFGFAENVMQPSCPTILTDEQLPTALTVVNNPIGFLSLSAGSSLIDGVIDNITTSVEILNDDCANAAVAPVGQSAFSTEGATTDGLALDPMVCDLGPFGDEQIHNDVWYCFTAPSTANYAVSTVNLAGFDTRLAVYDNGCGPDDPALVVACNDDEGGPPFESLLEFPAVASTSYKIRIGSFNDTTSGTGAFLIEEIFQPQHFCFGDGLGRPCKCGNDDTLNPGTGGCLNSAGTGAVLSTNGELSIATNDLQFALAGGPPTSFGVLLSGDNALGGGIGILGTPESDGLRCIGGNLLRHGGRSFNASGTASWGTGGAPAAGIIGQSNFVIGQTRHFQVRYREDPAPGPCGFGTNTTQGITLIFAP